jgi:hypothetical protein
VVIGGTTYYSNTVTIKVIPSGAREITIDMYDNTNSGGVIGIGWDGGSAMRVVINGTERAAVRVETTAANNTPPGQRGTNTYSFIAYHDDVVELFWVAGGSAQRNNAFIAYYTDLPPVPMFTPANSNSYSSPPWNGSNALAYRLHGTAGGHTMQYVVDGELLDSFKVTPVNFVTAPPAWNEGAAISLTAPSISPGNTVTAQGWQISDGEGGWSNFTATTAAMSHKGKQVRYYAVIGGVTYYSPNTVLIKVFSLAARQVVINMYDSYGDGWNGACALRIVVNGNDYATGVKVSETAANNNPSGQRSANTYTFMADTGDVVGLYWVTGNYPDECSFIAYYADTPPNPAFPANSTDWDGENALVFRLRGGLTGVATGTLLGEFTVP